MHRRSGEAAYDGCVARRRRLPRDGRGLVSSLTGLDQPVPSRSIRITGRMTTLAEPAGVGGRS
jgi:hypothetical protein